MYLHDPPAQTDCRRMDNHQNFQTALNTPTYLLQNEQKPYAMSSPVHRAFAFFRVGKLHLVSQSQIITTWRTHPGLVLGLRFRDASPQFSAMAASADMQATLRQDPELQALVPSQGLPFTDQYPIWMLCHPVHSYSVGQILDLQDPSMTRHPVSQVLPQVATPNG